MRSKSFSSVVKKYKAVLLDSYGVIKNHHGVIMGAANTIEKLRADGKLIRILTNDASKTAAKQVEQFRRLGLKDVVEEEIITSGMMAKHYLQSKKTKGLIAYLGTPAAAQDILDAGMSTIHISEVNGDNIDSIGAMVYLDDEGFDWNKDINRSLNLLRHRSIPAVVANSDQIYPVSRNEVSIATGGIAKLVEATLGREFIHFGKPDSQMFMHAFVQLNAEKKIEKSDILMVGDTLHTDILGGNKFGISTALVLSGNTRTANVKVNIKATGIIPDFICDSIAT
ncbi:MAG: TIGR01459 family HAD-type hydrolase [Saprospiraceae bacterium]|nr:TIGR01459 family HAD-type hydrolase [Saprospiraceae bacterium]